MEDLEAQLIEASKQNHRFKIIVTDGVFSMDGIVADLKGVCDLAEKYDALVMVDDSHATGFIGKTGRGTHEANEVMGRVDIITSTLGKALGGALGGFTSGKRNYRYASSAFSSIFILKFSGSRNCRCSFEGSRNAF
jgi:glycine C-acetyltransferase